MSLGRRAELQSRWSLGGVCNAAGTLHSLPPAPSWRWSGSLPAERAERPRAPGGVPAFKSVHIKPQRVFLVLISLGEGTVRGRGVQQLVLTFAVTRAQGWRPVIDVCVCVGRVTRGGGDAVVVPFNSTAVADLRPLEPPPSGEAESVLTKDGDRMVPTRSQMRSMT